MKNINVSNTIATGLAMFSMFFGAGNVVFPLELGQMAGDQNFYAMFGFLITAVGVPFLGLLSMTIYDGNYHDFFGRLGKIPGFFVILLLMGLVGPFGAMPRCIALSYSTIKVYFPGLSLPIFSFFSCILIFLLTYKKRRIIDILGYVLTPVLITSLGLIIVLGLMSDPDQVQVDQKAYLTFVQGFKEGYLTMDLMGAFFFSSVVLMCLKRELTYSEDKSFYKRLIVLTIKAGCIGMVLLGLVYAGFSYVSSFNSTLLEGTPNDEMLGVLSLNILGQYGGVITCTSVALACLTTAIALSAVFSEYIHIEIAQDKINYRTSLILTLIIGFIISTLDFKGILLFLIPILKICYPALIVLCVCNLLFKLYGFRYVKVPVLVTFLITVLLYFS